MRCGVCVVRCRAVQEHNKLQKKMIADEEERLQVNWWEVMCVCVFLFFL